MSKRGKDSLNIAIYRGYENSSKTILRRWPSKVYCSNGSLHQGAFCILLNSYFTYFHCVLDRICFDHDWMIRALDLQLTLIWDSLWNNWEQTWIKKRKCKNVTENKTEHSSHCNNPHCIHILNITCNSTPCLQKGYSRTRKDSVKLIQMTKNMGCVFMKPFARQDKNFQSEKEMAEEGCMSDL